MNGIRKIHSKEVVKMIFDLIPECQAMLIVKYNLKLQRSLEFDKNHYKILYLLRKLKNNSDVKRIVEDKTLVDHIASHVGFFNVVPFYSLPMETFVEKTSGDHLALMPSGEHLFISGEETGVYNLKTNSYTKLEEKTVCGVFCYLNGRDDMILVSLYESDSLLELNYTTCYSKKIKIEKLESIISIANLSSKSKNKNMIGLGTKTYFLLYDYDSQILKDTFISKYHVTCIIPIEYDNCCAFYNSNYDIFVYSLKNKAPFRFYKAHQHEIYAMIHLKKNPNFIVSGDVDGRLMFWNINKNSSQPVFISEEHTDAINCIVELESGRLVTCSDDKKLILWDAKGQKLISLLSRDEYEFNSIVEVEPETIIALSLGDQMMEVFEIDKGTSARFLRLPSVPRSLALSPSRELFCLFFRNGTVCRFGIRNETLSKHLYSETSITFADCDF